MDVFFSERDRMNYVKLLAEQGQIHGVRYLAWCLMSNHVHLVVIPDSESSLARGIGEAHRRYTLAINKRKGWRGYLFQGRFYSCPVEPTQILGVVRYVLRNPVRAGLVEHACDYNWSSAAWLAEERAKDALVHERGPLVEIQNWRSFLDLDEASEEQIRKHTRTGRPLGSAIFTAQVELLTQRELTKQKPGPKKRGHEP